MNSYRRLSNTYLLLVFGFLLFFPLIANADPLDNWHWRNHPTLRNYCLYRSNVTYGKKIFVAVGYGHGLTESSLGLILTSSDGVTWTSDGVTLTSTSEIIFPLCGVAYVNDIFVAVGMTGDILTSFDGVTWTSRNSKTSNLLYGVAYGNGTFVAVGEHSTIVTSSDGVTWTATTLEKDYTLIGIVYANNTFVALASLNTVLTSFDGKTWTARDIRPPYHSGFYEGIAYGNGMFVVVNSDILTSSDGVKWTQRASVTNNSLYGVAYGSNTFVAVGEKGTIVTSSDGATWVPRTSGTTNLLWAVVYGNGTFVAVGDDTILQSDPLGPPPEPDISVNRASINFGNVNIGSSPAQSVTVSNVGNANLTIGTITLPSPPFSKSADNCSGLTLSPGASCNVTYTFSPTSIGSFFSNSNIPSNDPDENPVTISLAGTGVSLNLPDITVTPLSLNFGNVNVGSSSTPQIATIRNDGSANLSLGSIAITGTNASEFSKTADACSGQVLTPGASCSLQVSFSPTFAGSKAATLSIPSNDPDENPVGVSLSGIGTTQQYTLTITKSGTGTGTVTSSPKGISCGTDCTEGYKPGTKLTLKAKADTNSTFTGWSGGGCSGTGSCVLTLESDTVVTANFAIKTQQLPPIISSITPTSGTAGTVVTIKGKNFGATQGTSFVSFGSTQAAINSWSNTQIKAVAPEGLSGEVPVTVTTSFGTSNGKIFAYKSADFRFPLTGDWSPITENFGEWSENQSPPLGYYGYHLAQDIARSASTPVYPMADGTVMFAEFVSGLGYAVHIQHKLSKGDPDGTYVVSVYYHMARLEEGGISLNVGQSVSKNNPIGYVSGNKDDYGTGPHLHFGIRKGKYKQGCDKRTKKWYYPGYTSIYLSKKCPASADDEKDKNKNNPIHQEIMSEWISDPGNFIRSRGGR